MSRFRLDELVDLGDGWFRRMRAGEELFLVTIALPGSKWSCPLSRWVEFGRLPEVAALAGEDDMSRTISISTMVVPARQRPGAQPDPRQLELPWSEP